MGFTLSAADRERLAAITTEQGLRDFVGSFSADTPGSTTILYSGSNSGDTILNSQCPLLAVLCRSI